MENFLKDKYCFSYTMTMTDISESVVQSRAEAISKLNTELSKYRILFKDLYKLKPSETELNLILNVAYYIAETEELYNELIINNELSKDKLIKQTKRNNLFFDKWNDYLITYVLILRDENFTIIKDYLNIKLTDTLKAKSQDNGIKKNDIRKGLVMAVGTKSNIVMTQYGEFFRSRRDKNDVCGTEVHRQSKKTHKNVGVKVLIVLLFISVIAYAAYRNYTNVVTTVMLQTTSNIRLEVNKYDKVVEASAKDKSGEELISETKLIDLNIDEALVEALRYAEKNKLIYDKKVLITVLGEELDYGSLKSTGAYLKNRKISVLVNNGGQQHKLIESIENISDN